MNCLFICLSQYRAFLFFSCANPLAILYFTSHKMILALLFLKMFCFFSPNVASVARLEDDALVFIRKCMHGCHYEYVAFQCIDMRH